MVTVHKTVPDLPSQQLVRRVRNTFKMSCEKPWGKLAKLNRGRKGRGRRILGVKVKSFSVEETWHVRTALGSFALSRDAECRLYEELLYSALPSPACRAELLQIPQPRSWKARYCVFQHNEHIPLTFFYHLVMNESMLHRDENWIKRHYSAPCRNVPLTWN